MWPFAGPKYPSVVLYFYDAWLMNIANSFIWRCSTKDVLLPLHRRNIGLHHCDIGCGTGYYLINHPEYQSENTVTLLDIEPSPLSTTTNRPRKTHASLVVQSHLHDILSSNPSIPAPPDMSSSSGSPGKYSSISLTYLLHTLPVPQWKKVQIFSKLKTVIEPSGVVFGATVLGRGPWHSFAGRVLLSLLNWEKRLSNLEDGVDPFVDALRGNFRDVSVEVVGSILVFEAREPIL